jgi:hypothetical protein
MDKCFVGLRTENHPKIQLYTTYYFEINVASHFQADFHLKKHSSVRTFPWYRLISIELPVMDPRSIFQ